MQRCSVSRRVVVVGGGVVGCATAYALARSGLAVTLIERDAIAAHASGRNAGNLNPLHGSPSALVPFALEAFRIHTEIQAELAQLGCAHYVALPVNRIYLGYDAADRRQLEETASLFGTTKGFSAAWLNGHQLREIEPRLDREMSFGVLTKGNLTIDGYEFTRSLADGAGRLGCSIIHATASGVSTCGERVTAINTRHGRVACDDIVLATGPWIADTQSWLGVIVPVEPIKGELLRMRLPQEPPQYDLTWDSTSIYRRGNGEIWIGASTERCGFDATPTAAAKESLLARATRMLPDIKNATLLDHVAALRPMSHTRMPIAARAPGWQNVYIANGGCWKGMLLSVGIARAIRDLLLNRQGTA
jgi:glycine oxidase